MWARLLELGLLSIELDLLATFGDSGIIPNPVKLFPPKPYDILLLVNDSDCILSSFSSSTLVY